MGGDINKYMYRVKGQIQFSSVQSTYNGIRLIDLKFDLGFISLHNVMHYRFKLILKRTISDWNNDLTVIREDTQ
jgi:hypothetical protein